jgi:hypothetical protein
MKQIAKISLGDTNIASFAKAAARETEEAKNIRYALNQYEYICVGIEQDVYDEEVFRGAMYSTFVKFYDRAKPFIDEARRTAGRDTIYQEFECVACRWKHKPLRAKRLKTTVK